MEHHLRPRPRAQLYGPRVVALKASDGSQQSGLPAPALAHQRHCLTLVDFEVDAAQGVQPAAAEPRADGERLVEPADDHGGRR